MNPGNGRRASRDESPVGGRATRRVAAMTKIRARLSSCEAADEEFDERLDDLESRVETLEIAAGIPPVPPVRPPVDPPEPEPPVRPPTRPPVVEPPVRPPIDPPTRPIDKNGVTVEIGILGIQRYTFVGVEDVETILFDHGIAVVLYTTPMSQEVVIANPFAGNGPVELPRSTVKFQRATPDTIIQSLTLNPGEAVFAGHLYVSANDSISKLKGVRDWDADILAGGGGFSLADGRMLYGDGDANEGSGSLIYPNIGYWADESDQGRRIAYRVMLGYAQRQPIFRWDLDEFEQNGNIVPHTFPRDFKGVDRTSSWAPQGYDIPSMVNPEVGLSPMPKVGGTHDALDQQHLGRMAHVTASCARWGSPLARMVQEMLAADVIASWVTPKPAADRQVARAESPNFVWWNCNDVKKHFARGSGCPFMGREWAQAVMVLANSVLIESQDDSSYVAALSYVNDLVVMIDAAVHVYGNSTVLKLTYNEPIFGYKSSAYEHKLSETNPQIPAGERPPIVKQFETGLQVAALQLASRAFDSVDFANHWVRAGYADLLASLADSIRNLDSELRVIGHPDWDDPKDTLWQPFVLRVRKARWSDAEETDLDALANSMKPNDSGNPCAAWSGDWPASGSGSAPSSQSPTR